MSFLADFSRLRFLTCWDAPGRTGIAVDGGTTGRGHSARGGRDASGGRPGAGHQETLDQAVQKADPSTAEDLLVRLNPSGWSSVTKQQLRTMADEGKGGASLGSVLPIRPHF